jgi:hypothetical protein
LVTGLLTAVVRAGSDNTANAPAATADSASFLFSIFILLSGYIIRNLCRQFTGRCTGLQYDRLGIDRADIFAGPASGASRFIDADAFTRYNHDGYGLAAFHAGKTAAVSGQTALVERHSDHIGPGFSGWYRIRNNSSFDSFPHVERSGDIEGRPAEGDESLAKKFLAGNTHETTSFFRVFLPASNPAKI